MKHKTILLGMVLILVGLAVVQFSLNHDGATQGEVASQDQGAIAAPNDPEMQAAFNKARKSLDYFLGVAESRPDETKGFALKVGVRDEGLTEFFWIYPFQKEDEGFSGRINTSPELVDNVFKGEVINFDRDQIVDWTFEDTATDIMHGNYTGCVELQRAAPENAEQFQELYGLNCDK
ncbi:DUF2314 domain-containing protein [Proteobacteria bacterium 005FR1]|nr:DUF2314 domain-containing protein [Proteobacteria bacterium 005FR1]